MDFVLGDTRDHKTRVRVRVYLGLDGLENGRTSVRTCSHHGSRNYHVGHGYKRRREMANVMALADTLCLQESERDKWLEQECFNVVNMVDWRISSQMFWVRCILPI